MAQGRRGVSQLALFAGALGFVVRPFWVLTAASVAAVLDVLFSGRW